MRRGAFVLIMAYILAGVSADGFVGLEGKRVIDKLAAFIAPTK